jgi:hypothetical protein
VDPAEIYDAIGTLCADLKSIAYQPIVIFARRNEIPEQTHTPRPGWGLPYAASPQNWAGSQRQTV